MPAKAIPAKPGDDVKVRLGRRIKGLREALGMSQEECAYACRISRVYLGSIERGDQAATIDVLDKIARGLDRELPELLGEATARRNDGEPDVISNTRAFAERLAAYAADATEDERRRFERVARAFFGLSVAKKAEDGRPKVRKTGFERRKPQTRRG